MGLLGSLADAHYWLSKVTFLLTALIVLLKSIQIISVEHSSFVITVILRARI